MVVSLEFGTRTWRGGRLQQTLEFVDGEAPHVGGTVPLAGRWHRVLAGTIEQNLRTLRGSNCMHLS